MSRYPHPGHDPQSAPTTQSSVGLTQHQLSPEIMKFLKMTHPDIYKKEEEKIEPPPPPPIKIPEIQAKPEPIPVHKEQQNLLRAWAKGSTIDSGDEEKVEKIVEEIHEIADISGYDDYEWDDPRGSGPIIRDYFGVVHYHENQQIVNFLQYEDEC